MAIYVSNTSDNDSGSLRQAIIEANNTPGADTILFEASLNGETITLTSGSLWISESLTIDGDLDDDGIPDIAVQRDEMSNAFRVFNIDDYNSSTLQEVTLEGLLITGGSVSRFGPEDDLLGGAGIRSVENLTLRSSTVSGNSLSSFSGSGGYTFSGGGVYNRYGNLSLHNSTVSGNSANGGSSGGGIFNRSGNLRLYNSTVSDNFTEGGNGGGIYNRNGTVILNYSTVSNNVLDSDYRGGGGIYNRIGNLNLNNSTVSGNSTLRFYSRGGGIYSSIGNLTLNNSTVSGNSTGGGFASGGGIANRYGNLTLSNSTVSGNSTADTESPGGGIHSASINLTLRSSLIAGNRAYSSSGQEIATSNTSISVNANNLFGDSEFTNAQAFTNFPPGDNDLTATSDGSIPKVLEAILAPLANNDGDTRTHALVSGSPAIDGGNNLLGFDTDQRGAGFVREFGAGADIGAFELQPVTPNPANQIFRDGFELSTDTNALGIWVDTPDVPPWWLAGLALLLILGWCSTGRKSPT